MPTLIYSRTNPTAQIYDRRVLHFDNMGHKSTYTNGFVAVTRVVCNSELSEAKRRVVKVGRWHKYEASPAFNNRPIKLK